MIYAILILLCQFSVNERVAARVTYREMLGLVGGVGFFILTWMLVLGGAQSTSSLLLT